MECMGPFVARSTLSGEDDNFVSYASLCLSRVMHSNSFLSAVQIIYGCYCIPKLQKTRYLKNWTNGFHSLRGFFFSNTAARLHLGHGLNFTCFRFLVYYTRRRVGEQTRNFRPPRRGFDAWVKEGYQTWIRYNSGEPSPDGGSSRQRVGLRGCNERAVKKTDTMPATIRYKIGENECDHNTIVAFDQVFRWFRQSMLNRTLSYQCECFFNKNERR